MESCYDLLGVSSLATPTELRAGYRRRMLEVHPDKGGTLDLCQRVIGAFELLADAGRRSEYDAMLARAAAGDAVRVRRGSAAGRRACCKAQARSPTTGQKQRQQKNTQTKASCDKTRPRVDTRLGKMPTGEGQKHVPAHRDVMHATMKSQGTSSDRSGDELGGGCANARGKGQKPKSHATITSACLRTIAALLRRLKPDVRRRLFEASFSERQRRELEQYMRSAFHASSSKSKHCLTIRRRLHRATSQIRLYTWPPLSPIVAPVSLDSDGSAAASNGTVATHVRELADIGVCNDNVAALSCTVSFHGQVARRTALSKKALSLGPADVLESDCAKLRQTFDCGSVAASKKVGVRSRGISSVVYKKKPGYIANIFFHWLILRAKLRRNLSAAVDDHIVLLAIKLRIFNEDIGDGFGTSADASSFEQRLMLTVKEVLEEHGVSPAEIGLSIGVAAPAYHWIGRSLVSPLYNWKSFDLGLRAWRKFRDVSAGHCARGGRGLMHRPGMNPNKAAEAWEGIRQTYLEVWTSRGADPSRVSEKLERLWVLNTHRRQRALEWWERTQMGFEDRSQRLRSRAERLEMRRVRIAQRCADRVDATNKRWELRRMRREDNQSRRWRGVLRRSEEAGLRYSAKRKAQVDEHRILARLERLLRRWAVQMELRQRVLRRKRLREQALKQAEERRFRAKKERDERLNARRVQALRRSERDARWRWLRRPDLTTEEMLRGW